MGSSPQHMGLVQTSERMIQCFDQAKSHFDQCS